MPEVKLLAIRLVKIGFISLLEVSASIRSIKEPNEALYKCSLGAFEVWALSKGMLNAKWSFTKNQFASFKIALRKSNKACAKITGGVKQI